MRWQERLISSHSRSLKLREVWWSIQLKIAIPKLSAGLFHTRGAWCDFFLECVVLEWSWKRVTIGSDRRIHSSGEERWPCYIFVQSIDNEQKRGMFHNRWRPDVTIDSPRLLCFHSVSKTKESVSRAHRSSFDGEDLEVPLALTFPLIKGKHTLGALF